MRLTRVIGAAFMLNMSIVSVAAEILPTVTTGTAVAVAEKTAQRDSAVRQAMVFAGAGSGVVALASLPAVPAVLAFAAYPLFEHAILAAFAADKLDSEIESVETGQMTASVSEK
jgi:hypothetical protein